ncbi:hypothetical protein DFS34DRAFT_638702 [Phlyctochytrium arcticum]|nr:hypothetical protein DFS34DRAFT_638702 [Phlyctochytrium arcticum]
MDSAFATLASGLSFPSSTGRTAGESRNSRRFAESRYEFFTNPQVKEDFKALIRAIVLREQRFTDRLYQDDELVPGWEL